MARFTSFVVWGAALTLVLSGCKKYDYRGDPERLETEAIERSIPELLPLMEDVLVARETGNKIITNEAWDALTGQIQNAEARAIAFQAEVVGVSREGFQISSLSYEVRDRKRRFGESPSIRFYIRKPEFIHATDERLRDMRSGELVKLRGMIHPQAAAKGSSFAYELNLSQVELVE